MIGNSEIHVASIARRLGHGAQRIDAIGQICMGVQTPQISLSLTRLGSLRFSAHCALAFGNDVSDGDADARDFTQPIFCDDLLEGHGQGE
jgi:hypothetical protein